ncbi:aryl-alcohol dehydrogenase-like predicted oxidoreductase [Amycolatopsis lexingtonensis]|uniref:Aryl-alcohol dehydrogenase-like predicted oxidoreductase n=1 Tax=Amycolatopsis lexingtonensis TaxID=218822 RepID=A0ABR9HZ27_9PSEU|nr:aldo/keto reductase [Amycolatopsis lexingtonensis]MBE1496189.1 aryl-alcohol dehydrogenase-like predicted oxidoreductase [Amycolatopsis lexingtonensis]
MTSKTLTASPVALGTWAWGDSGEVGDGQFGSRLTESGLREVVEKAHSNGFTLWDTAVVYGMGRSETVLAQALKGYARSEYQLSTKFTPQAAGDGGNPVADMLEQSLDRLGTDYVDLYWIHNPADVARWTPLLIPLLRSGTIKHVGVSNHNLTQIALADQILGEAGFRVEAVQNHHSLLYRSSERAGILDHCREHDVRFFSYMVLEQGALTGRYSPAHPLPEGSDRAAVYNGILPRLQTLTDRMAAIGEDRGASAADVATAWAIAKGTTPIIGVTKAGYLDGLVRAHGIELADEEIAELETLADAADVDTRGWWEPGM